MPTLFRFLAVLGTIAGVVAGSLYVLAEYFQPEPKEISKALRNVKATPVGGNSSGAPSEPSIGLPPSHRAQ
ncbi:MAG: histidine kinase [Alphaproteobacteria bacterium]